MSEQGVTMTEKQNWKSLLPYIGVPMLCGALYLVKRGQLEPVDLLLRSLLLAFGYVASLTDLREKRVPNGLVGAMAGAWVLVIVPQLFYQTEEGIRLLLNGGVGFLAGGLVFLVVYMVSRKGLGGGDVKLMAVSGLYLGLDGVMPVMLIGSVLAAVMGIVLILSKKIGRQDAIPLVPFLYVGMLLTVFIQ